MTAPAELTVAEAILQRRSCKRFKPDPIPDDLLNRLIDLTLNAPSSFNLQPWRIVLIENQAQKEALARVSWNQPQITTAPAVLVFAAKINAWKDSLEPVIAQAVELGAWPEKFVTMIRNAAPGFHEVLGPKLREYVVKDAIIAATHCALVAESLGLSTCYMNGWEEGGVKEVIGAKDDPEIVIALVLPVGYGLDFPKFSGRLPRSTTFFRGKLK